MLSRRSVSVRLAAVLSFAVLLVAVPALAAPHLRGTIDAVKDGVVSVKPAAGATEEIKVDAKTPLFLVTNTDLAAVKDGKFVGVTSVEKDGKAVAVEVHVFADSLRGLAEGHYPWDLGSKPNMMTNANIATVNSVGDDRVLKLEYKGGEQTIEVPKGTPIVAFDKGASDQLVAGRKVFVIFKNAAKDVAAIVVGAQGVTPPM
jgi:hypothetical protein